MRPNGVILAFVSAVAAEANLRPDVSFKPAGGDVRQVLLAWWHRLVLPSAPT
jgi:hypothetical protein